jgi:hypothetical protein
MPEWRKIFEAEDSDVGGGAKYVLPLKMGAPGLYASNGQPNFLSIFARE